MFTEQWICKCGTHNSELRKKCRDCGGLRSVTTSQRRESPLEIIDQIFSRSNNASGADNPQGRIT